MSHVTTASSPSGEHTARVLALPLPAAPEQDLVVGLCERRPSSARALYDQYSALVRQVLIRTLGSATDVDDLIQETLITVIDRAPSLKKALSLRSFIIGVAINLAKNEIRKRKVRRFVGLDDAIEVPLVAAHDAAAAQGARHLYRALDRLELNARMAFVLRHVQGCDLAETAAACGCSIATIKRKLNRAEARFSAIVQADPVLRELLQHRGVEQ
jgi:RNA polymerase sigma-70 factor (ECF subfamily)